MRQNFLRALSLLGQRLGTPLAQTHTVAIALGGEEKAALLILHREAGAPQAQRFAQGRAGDVLPTDRQGGYIARRGKRGLSEPVGRCGRVREQAQPGESLLHLFGGELDGIKVVVRIEVGGAVHGHKIGKGGAPDVFAGFSHAVGDGEVACPGGVAAIVEHIGQHTVHQRREAGIVLLISGAPVAAEDCIC